jgi:hypothetical protein
MAAKVGAAPEPYNDSIEHLSDELARVDLLIRRGLRAARAPTSAAGPDEFRGLVISEQEIDEIVGKEDFFGERWRREAKQQELLALDGQVYDLRQRIDARRDVSEGVGLSLAWLADEFELSPAEMDILLLALAPELEPQYETLYAYLQNDVTRKHLSVDLALNLICRSAREKLYAREIFAPTAPLISSRLIDLGEESHDRQPSLLRKFVKMDETVVGFLLGQSPVTASCGVLTQPTQQMEALEAPAFTRARLTNLAQIVKRVDGESVFIRVTGESDSSLRQAAECLCNAIGRPLLFADIPQQESDSGQLSLLKRDARLWNAVLAIRAIEEGDHEPEHQRCKQTETQLWRGLRDFKGVALLLGSSVQFLRVPQEARVWRIEIPPASFDVRKEAWEAGLNGFAQGADAARLADTFHFGLSRVRQTIDFARSMAALRDPACCEPTTQDLLDAGRALTSPNMNRYAIRIEARYAWPDIVLPPEKTRQLRSIAARMKLRRVVHRDWGFGQKLSRGKGLIVLFTGPSGTGKTMAAEVLAGELGLDLYQIDLSSVVSKYIGETEKNLSAIFREAEQSQALLFFDEADSLFGKRTEVKDAHDRYANIEVNYLLQRVEAYQGIVILATNLQQNLDEAFLRRIQEVVEFPFPDEALRESIWRGHFPAQAPRDGSIDFGFLARQFKLTGGNIKNIVVNAAFLAAQDSARIGTSHLMLATKAEFQKEGKLCVKSDFGPYYDLIQTKQ